MLYAPHDLYLIRSARTLASHWARQNHAESTGLPSSRPMSVSGAELPRIRARYRITQLTPSRGSLYMIGSLWVNSYMTGRSSGVALGC